MKEITDSKGKNSVQHINICIHAIIRAIDLYDDIKSAHIFASSAYDYLVGDNSRRMTAQKNLEWGLFLLGQFDNKSLEIEAALDDMYLELEAVKILLEDLCKDC